MKKFLIRFFNRAENKVRSLARWIKEKDQRANQKKLGCDFAEQFLFDSQNIEETIAELEKICVVNVSHSSWCSGVRLAIKNYQNSFKGTP